MKTKTFLALFCLLCISSGFSSCQRHSSDQWKLVWEDNFDQKTGFDPQVWSKIPRGKSDWNNYMTDFDSCFDMRDGNMVLRGIINYSQPNDTAPYLTGGIYTKGKKAFSNGRLEIRAKLNGARGEWPAIWMLPIDAPWPMGGEIDIMGTSESRYNRLSDYTYQLYAQSGYQRQSVITLRRCDQSDDYNVYSVEMYPDSIAFYINDTHTFTYPRIETDKEGQFPFDQPFYLLIDMQLGGSWVGAVDPKELPVEMYVDWVRFYQKEK